MANDIQKAFNWGVDTCNKDNVGYSQAYRNQQTVGGITYYDCSSFIWYALLNAQFDVYNAYRNALGYSYSGNAITTAYMAKFLLALGFDEVDLQGEWKPGDIVLKPGHVEMVHTGGTASGVTMGAHTDEYPLAQQVSINSFVTQSSYYSSIYRYGKGATGGSSLYVIAALCGNAYKESNINPGLWEVSSIPEDWTSLKKGYGLFQWTNTDGDTHGRLYKFHEWMISNGYAINDGDAQLKYLQVESDWAYKSQFPDIKTLDDFLSSKSTDIEYLTNAFKLCWERNSNNTLPERVEWANRCYEYIQNHKDDTSITTWINEDRYLTDSEILNNAVMLYRGMQAYDPEPQPPTPTTRTKLPIWMYSSRWRKGL